MENNQYRLEPVRASRAADSESGSVRLGEGKLVRQLKNRHVAMIRYANLSLVNKLLTPSFVSIGGAIGTGESYLDHAQAVTIPYSLFKAYS